jgi:ribosomal protein S18 acetylase RimI-like enzyme
VLAQENIVAVNAANEIVAFMSFKNHYPHSENFPGVAEKCDVISYISTICVLCEYRRFGIARRFYELVETKLPQNINCVSTRTWSTNNSHIRLLEKRGYALTRTIFNDRVTDTGEKLDTVYFCKRVKF